MLLMFKKSFLNFAALMLLAGCSVENDTSNASNHNNHAKSPHQKHRHIPPHGGAPVVLGEELYHLEFVLDEASASLHCYVLDGHMENFIRIQAAKLILEVEPNKTVVLTPVVSRATGESVGNASHFSARLDWAKERKRFAAVLREITIQGNRFENVAFRYPEGNESH